MDNAKPFPTPFSGKRRWRRAVLWLGIPAALLVLFLGYGDREKSISREECATARMLAADMRRRVEQLQEILEDDIVLNGRYPRYWYEPRLLSRTHQPLLRKARKQASANLASLAARIAAAGCARNHAARKSGQRLARTQTHQYGPQMHIRDAQPHFP